MTGYLDEFSEPVMGGGKLYRVRKPVTAEQLAECAAKALEGVESEGRPIGP
jgi:hypothetical protein